MECSSPATLDVTSHWGRSAPSWKRSAKRLRRRPSSTQPAPTLFPDCARCMAVTSCCTATGPMRTGCASCARPGTSAPFRRWRGLPRVLDHATNLRGSRRRMTEHDQSTAAALAIMHEGRRSASCPTPDPATTPSAHAWGNPSNVRTRGNISPPNAVAHTACPLRCRPSGQARKNP
jgi:hypothetical protein